MDILVENGKIKEIASVINQENNTCNIIDAAGYIVSSGLVDVHVHFRDPGLPIRRIFSLVHRQRCGAVLRVLC